MNNKITVELTMLEVITLAAVGGNNRTEEDRDAVALDFTQEIADQVAAEDAGFTAYLKLRTELTRRGVL